MNSRKYIVFIIIGIALIIIFYPVEKKPNLSGIWSIDKLIIKDKEIHVRGSFIISDNNIRVIGSNSIDEGITNGKYYIKDDSLRLKIIDSIHILSKDTINYNGNYKIDISQQLEGSGERAVFVYQVSLSSNNKKIILSRTENVRWNKRVQRGMP